MKYITLVLLASAFSSTALAAQTTTASTKSIMAKDRFSANAFVGIQTFTGGLGDIFDNGEAAGVEANYSINPKFRIGAAYSSSNSFGSLRVTDMDESLGGTAKLNTLSIFGKYFLQKGAISPYLLFGFSQINRRVTNFQTATEGKDSSSSVDYGIGSEFKFNKGRNFISLQALYSRVNFPNENREIVITYDLGDPFTTDITPSGDILSYNVSFGVYF